MKPIKILQYTILAGIVILALLRLAPYFNDFSKLWELKDQLNSWWIAAAIFSQIFQYVGDGWFSQLLLQVAQIKVSIKDSFRIASLNVFAAHLLPLGEAGGLATAYHFYRKLGVDPEKFIFLAFCWTAIIHIILLVLFILPIPFLQELPIAINSSIIIISVTIGILIIISAYLTRKQLIKKLEKLLGKYSWAKPFFTFFRNLRTYKKMMTDHPWLMFFSLIACFIYYASNIATLIFSFLAFGILPSIPLIVFAYSAALIFSKITLAPAGIGATEATLILIFLEAHVDPNLTVAAVIVYRLISFWLPIPAGMFSFYTLRKDTKNLETSGGKSQIPKSKSQTKHK